MTLEIIFGTVGGLAASIAAAHVLGPQIVGEYSYLLWAVTAVAGAAGLGLPLATRKFAAERIGAGEIHAALAFVNSAWRIQVVAAVLTTGIAIAGVLYIAVPDHRLYVILNALGIAPLMLMEIPGSASAAAQRYRANVVPGIVGGLVNVTGIALSLTLRWDLIGLSASLLAARVVDLLLRLHMYKRVSAELLAREPEPPPATTPDFLNARILRFCAAAAVLQLLNLIVWDRSEVFFLGRYCSARQVAYYTIPFNIAAQALLAVRAFSSSAGAHLMHRVGQDTEAARAFLAVSMRYVLIISAPMLLGLAALSGPLMQVLYGRAYHGAGPVLAIVGALAVARAVLVPVLFAFSAFEMQGRALGAMLVCAALNVGLDFLLIPKHGAIGAAWANGLAQCAATCILWIVLTRGWRTGVSVRAALPAALAACGATLPAAILALLLPPWPALLIGIPIGALLYVPLLRLTGAVTPGDRGRLEDLIPMLPQPLRASMSRMLSWLAGGGVAEPARS